MNNRFVKNHLVNKDFRISLIMKFALKWFRRLEIKKIYWLDQLAGNELECLRQQHYVISKTATTINNDYHLNTVLIPKTNLYLFHNALIHTRSSNFIYGPQKNLVVERIINADLHYCDYSTGYLRYHNNTHALIKRKSKIKCKRLSRNTLYIGGNGAYNYYHWLIEISPKLLLITPELIKKYNIEYLVLDQAIQDTPSIQEILNLFLNHQKLSLKIIYNKNNELSLFKNLFYINHRNNFVFNSKERLSSVHFSYFCPDLINTIRNVCLKKAKLNSSQENFPLKIFLARKPHTVRAYNQNEILEYFEQQGFSPLYLEDYSFLEQVRIFYQAKFIVGPTGAAWSNIIFSQADTQALSWLPEQISEFSVFSTLANLVQCDMKFVFAKPKDKQDTHSEYSVYLDEVIKLYKKMSS